MIEVVETGEEYGPCWIWQGGTYGGYGVITVNTKHHPTLRIGRRPQKGSNWVAIMPHQLFYFLKHGNPPKGSELGHLCTRRTCCNPDHVRPVSRPQNRAEMYRMPALSRGDRERIEEYLEDDRPTAWIASELCISVWSVRQIARELYRRQQTDLFLPDPEVPF